MKFLDWTNQVTSRLSPVVGLDLGSQTVRVWTNGVVIIDQPALVATDSTTEKVLAVGTAAAELQHRLTSRTIVTSPMQAGKLAQPEAATQLLRICFAKALRGQFFSPSVIVSLPTTATPAVIETLTQLLYQLGVKEVIGVTQPLAAAIGAGVPVADASGGLVAVLGAGVMEVAVVALGSVVASAGQPVAGQWLIQAIQRHVAKTLQVTISQEVAAELLHKVARVGASAHSNAGASGVNGGENSPKRPLKSLLVTGKALDSGAPREVEIRADQLTPAVQEWVSQLEALITQLLRQLPPELTVDVVTKGLLLTGGLGQLAGLENYLVKKLGIPVATVETPSQVVIKGLGIISQNLDQYKHSLAYEGRE